MSEKLEQESKKICGRFVKNMAIKTGDNVAIEDCYFLDDEDKKDRMYYFCKVIKEHTFFWEIEDGGFFDKQNFREIGGYRAISIIDDDVIRHNKDVVNRSRANACRKMIISRIKEITSVDELIKILNILT